MKRQLDAHKINSSPKIDDSEKELLLGFAGGRLAPCSVEGGADAEAAIKKQIERHIDYKETIASLNQFTVPYVRQFRSPETEAVLNKEIEAEVDRLLNGCFKIGDGYVELRAFSKNKKDKSVVKTFVQYGDWHRIYQFMRRNMERRDVYFGVAPRKDASKGTTKNCTRLRCVFVDIDFKTTPKDVAWRRIETAEQKPDLVVNSGGGFHCYWFLTQPFELPAEAAKAKQYLRAMAKRMGGDLTAAEPARILRLPGTLNHKYNPSRPIRIEPRLSTAMPTDEVIDAFLIR